ncbi:MAG: terpene cyclase/mutase family protein [Planctomycetaceae bacterium]
MRTIKTVVVVLFVVSVHGITVAEENRSSTESIRKSVARALPYLERDGLSWMKTKKCVSCHRTSFLVWSHLEARRIGVAIDDKKLDDWTTWSLEQMMTKRKQDGQLVASRNLDGVRQMLLARKVDPSMVSQQNEKIYAQFVSLLISGQQKNGSWKPAGQLPFQKRPKPETTEVSTMWAAIALNDESPTPELKATQQKAGNFINAATARRAKSIKETAKSIEWFAVRLLLEHQQGNEKAVLSSYQKLMKLQNADGGWPWLRGGKSDAMATGQVLYVLSRVGRDDSREAIQRAQNYLLKTQRKDGSWAVHGTKAKKQDRPRETANYWGTGWAVIGLARTLN